MFTALIGLVAFAIIALIGWGIDEAKGKTCVYEKNQQEEEVEEQLAQSLHKNGFHELSIKDVIKSISTKGFKTT